MLKQVKWESVVSSIALIVIGLLMIIYPNVSATVVAKIIGVCFIVFGAINIIAYFLLNIDDILYRNDFVIGLLALIFGAAAPTVGGLMQSATGSYTSVWLMMTAISVVAAILMSIARPPVKKAKSQEHTAENIGA